MSDRGSISVSEYDRQQGSLAPFGALLCVGFVVIAFIAKDGYLMSVRPIAIVAPLIFFPGIGLMLRFAICKDSCARRQEEGIVLFEPLVLTVLHIGYIIGFWVLILAIVYSVVFRFTGLSGFILVLAGAGLGDIVHRTLGLFRASGKSYVSLSVEVFEMRGSYGEVTRVLWSQEPRVVGVKRGRFLKIDPTVSGSGLAELWTLPIRYSAIARIVDHYTDNPEDRSALGTEEGLRQIERLST